MTVRTKIILSKCIVFPVYFIAMPIVFILYGFKGIFDVWKTFLKIGELREEEEQ